MLAVKKYINSFSLSRRLRFLKFPLVSQREILRKRESSESKMLLLMAQKVSSKRKWNFRTFLSLCIHPRYLSTMFSNCTTFTNKLNHLFQHDNSFGGCFTESRVEERRNIYLRLYRTGETLTHVIKFGRRQQTAESCESPPRSTHTSQFTRKFCIQNNIIQEKNIISSTFFMK